MRVPTRTQPPSGLVAWTRGQLDPVSLIGVCSWCALCADAGGRGSVLATAVLTCVVAACAVLARRWNGCVTNASRCEIMYA
jgi:hypothetical protein